MKKAGYRLLGILIIMAISQNLYAVTIDITGSIPRGNTSVINIELQLDGVATVDLINNPREALYSSLKIFMNDISNDKHLLIDGETRENTTHLEDYSMVYKTEPDVQLKDDGTTNTVIVIFQIKDNGTTEKSISDLLEAEGKVEIKVEYTSKSDSNTDDAEAEIKQDAGVVDQAISKFEISSTHKKLLLSWEKEESVKYNNEETKSPTGVNVILIDTTKIQEYTFQAKEYKENANEEAIDSTCQFSFSPGSDGNPATCQINPCTPNDNDGQAYLSIENLPSVDGIEVKSTTSNSSQTIAFSNLDESKEYAAFAQYEPSGIQLSACIIGSPITNLSLSELNGAKEATEGNPACFIATAAYGTPLHPSIDILRWFRDRFLINHPPGRFLVKTYYKHSPPIARWISNHPHAKAIIRCVLWPIVGYLSLLRTYPAVTFLISVLFILTIMAIYTSKKGGVKIPRPPGLA